MMIMIFLMLALLGYWVERWLRFAWVGATFLGAGLLIVLWWPQPAVKLSGTISYPPELRREYGQAVKSVRDFTALQQELRAHVVSDQELETLLSRIQLDASTGNFASAQEGLAELKLSLSNWKLELSTGPAPTTLGGEVTLPILMYHYPPPDFDQELTYLEQAGYTVIDMDEAFGGLRGNPLPAKPVVITFDDGFAAQMDAFAILKRHNMKATFYIISGGVASAWCLGADRRYGDPLQPEQGCGDAYLDWNQVRELDRSGLITIGGHTVNHRNLTMLPAADQREEIADNKLMIERKLGHAIRHFAYPYGAYNDDSIQAVRDAGYLTAVTTIGGTAQPTGPAYELRRLHSAYGLP